MMSYMCNHGKGECDCCGECRKSSTTALVCDICGEEIEVNSKYFIIDGNVYCEECLFNDYGYFWDGNNDL